MANKIQLRRDTAINWSSSNPTLSAGEVGVDLTNKKIKIGDGATRWNSLEYWDDKEPNGFNGTYNSLTGKPSLFSGSYVDLTSKPTIPTNTNQLTNGAGFITSADIPNIPTDISDLTDTEELLGQGSGGSVDLSDYQAGSDGIRLESDQSVVILRNGVTGIDANGEGLQLYANNISLNWDGLNLELPEGADIVDSNGDSVLGGSNNSYTPEDTDNWNEPTINTVQAALDELAARLTALQNYEIDGGNAYTPPEGELIIDGNGA